jgi:hypothetical protein
VNEAIPSKHGRAFHVSSSSLEASPHKPDGAIEVSTRPRVAGALSYCNVLEAWQLPWSAGWMFLVPGLVV